VAVGEGVTEGAGTTSVFVGKLDAGATVKLGDGLETGVAVNELNLHAERGKARSRRTIVNFRRKGAIRGPSSTNARQHLAGEHLEHPGGP